MRSANTLGWIVAAIMLSAGSTLGDPAPVVRYKIIVHPKNPVTSVERVFVSRVFLKKETRWSNGEIVRPVDLPADSPIRRAFSREIFGRPSSAIRSYWQQSIFSGRGLPPPELESDEKVIEYVREHIGAIGYVSEHADVTSVKVLTLR